MIEDRYIIIRMRRDEDSDREVYEKVGYTRTRKDAHALISSYVGKYGDILFRIEIEEVSEIIENATDLWMVCDESGNPVRIKYPMIAIGKGYGGWLDLYQKFYIDDIASVIEASGSKPLKEKLAMVSFDCALYVANTCGLSNDAITSAVSVARKVIIGEYVARKEYHDYVDKLDYFMDDKSSIKIGSYEFHALNSAYYACLFDFDKKDPINSQTSIRHAVLALGSFYAVNYHQKKTNHQCSEELSTILNKYISLRDILLAYVEQ